MSTDTREIIFQHPGVLQFRCRSCSLPITWGRYRTALKGGAQCHCVIDRHDCQGQMMSGACPSCGQVYAKRMCRAQMRPNEELER